MYCCCSNGFCIKEIRQWHSSIAIIIEIAWIIVNIRIYYQVSDIFVISALKIVNSSCLRKHVEAEEIEVKDCKYGNGEEG